MPGKARQRPVSSTAVGIVGTVKCPEGARIRGHFAPGDFGGHALTRRNAPFTGGEFGRDSEFHGVGAENGNDCGEWAEPSGPLRDRRCDVTGYLSCGVGAPHRRAADGGALGAESGRASW